MFCMLLYLESALWYIQQLAHIPLNSTHIKNSAYKWLAAPYILNKKKFQVQQLLVKQVTDMELVRVGSRQQIQKGFHLLNILGPKIIPHILPCCDLVLTTLLDLITDGNFLDVMCFSGILLSTLTRNADLRKKFVLDCCVFVVYSVVILV